MPSANPAHDRGIPPEEPHGVSVAMPHHKVNYYMIFVALVALTVVTVAIAFKRFDNEMVNVLLALLVASVKAMFVATYFMHLKFEGKLIYTIFMVPLVLTVILVCALIPDIGRGIHHIIYAPPIIHHDALPLTNY
jgi:cytochrome c oxidase subunit 4